jgi:hypothetical protein
MRLTMPTAYGQPKMKEYANEDSTIDANGAALVSFNAANAYFVLPTRKEAPRKGNA